MHHDNCAEISQKVSVGCVVQRALCSVVGRMIEARQVNPHGDVFVHRERL